MTLAGDPAQRMVFDTGCEDWDGLLEALALDGVEVSPLRIGYRSTAEIQRFARALLGRVASGERITIDEYYGRMFADNVPGLADEAAAAAAVEVAALDHERAGTNQGGHLGIVERLAEIPFEDLVLALVGVVLAIVGFLMQSASSAAADLMPTLNEATGAKRVVAVVTNSRNHSFTLYINPLDNTA